MRVAVISDIHDHLWNLAAAIEHVSALAESLICCGDLCSPFVMDALARFPGRVDIVFGNNDADLYRITRKSSDRVRVHGELFETELDGKKVAVNHFNYLARPMAAAGLYDFVCYGHNHNFGVARVGRTVAINPGPIMGARFPDGKWEDVLPTFAIMDTRTGAVDAFGIHADAGAARRIAPYVFEVADGWPGNS
jgi:putative phosphoesterase